MYLRKQLEVNSRRFEHQQIPRRTPVAQLKTVRKVVKGTSYYAVYTYFRGQLAETNSQSFVKYVCYVYGISSVSLGYNDEGCDDNPS